MQRRSVLMPRLSSALAILFGALMLAVFVSVAHAEIRPINPLAAEATAPPSAYAISLPA
jgi:hypothetical protein